MHRRLFRALRHRDFRLFFLGQLVSVTGTWMQSVAQAWLVYRLTGSSSMLGLVAFAGLAPVLFFGLPSGALADRFVRRNLLLFSHGFALLQASTLAVLALSGQIETWQIVGLALMLGLVHAVEMPARHAFIAELVPADDLANAIALNSSLFNLARFVGPAMAGAVVMKWGEGIVFAFNAVSFVAVLVGLSFIPPRANEFFGHRSPNHMTGGLRHAWHTRPVRNALLLLGSISLAGTSYTVLMPVIAHRLFGGEADLLGIMLGASGVGALVAALRMAWQGGRQPLERQAGIAGVAGSMGLMLLGIVHDLWLALALLALLGYSLTTLVASVNTLIQLNTPHALRGRTMALFSTLFIGLNSLGNLLSGVIAERLGITLTVSGFGLFCLIGTTVYWRKLNSSRFTPGS
jgi:MFS family permease